MIAVPISAIAQDLHLSAPSLDASQQFVHSVVIDSRKVRPGSLFVAIKGDHDDGHRYVDQALARGAVAAVVQFDLWRRHSSARQAILPVPDTVEALGRLGRKNRRRSGCTVVGITGTCGKTTTKEWLATALQTRFKVEKAPKSFNNAIGVPLTLLLAGHDTDIVVVEIGSNHPGEIAELVNLCKPSVAVLTAIGEGHLEGFGDLAGVKREKACIFHALRKPGACAFANANNPAVLEVVENRPRVYLTGRHPQSILWGRVIERWGENSTVEIEGLGRREIRLLSPLLLDNLLLALGVAWHLGVPKAQGFEAIARAPMIAGRQKVQRVGPITLIDDSYNANPLSMRAGLEALVGFGGRRVACLGDMLELGEKSSERHVSVGRAAARSGVEQLFLVGKYAQDVAEGARAAGMNDAAITIVAFDDLRAALLKVLAPGDVVLFKASRRIGLERILASLRDVFEPMFRH